MPVVLRPDYSGYTSPNRNHHEPGKDQILAYLKTKRQNGISQLLTIIEKQFNYRAMTPVLNHNCNTFVSDLKIRKKKRSR